MVECVNKECGFYKQPCEGLKEGENCSKFKPLIAQMRSVDEVPCSDGLVCEDCEAFDQIKEEGLHGTEIVFDDICTLIPSNDNCDIDRDGPNELARNCPKRQAS